MMKFNETPEQEALLNSIIKSGKSWRQVRIDNAKLGADLDVTKEQFEARDGWIVWRGGEQPVAGGDMVEAKWSDGDTTTTEARELAWFIDDLSPNVIAYRLHKPEKMDMCASKGNWSRSLLSEQPKGHQHAELYQELADIAKSSATPWEEFQIKINGEWRGLKGDVFHKTEYYRRKPKTKLIHGVEVPDISFVPSCGERFYCPDIACLDYYDICIFDDNLIEIEYSKLGLCYPDSEEGKQAAILHTKAMLGITNEAIHGGGREQNNEGDKVCE